MKRIPDYLRLMRPEQWVKNVFVVVPLIFSKNLFNVSLFSGSALAFFSFCLAASSVYIINDIADRELDKLHPIKKNRPIAAGAVNTSEGWTIAVSLIFVSFVLLFAGRVHWTATIPIVLYIIMNLLYSFGLKKIVLIDVFVIAAGFILRIVAGGYAIDVKISSWLIMTTLFISIFLGVAKRRSEFLNMSSESDGHSALPSTREVLEDYDLSLIDQILSVSAASVIIAYALYTVSERTVRAFGTEALIFTTIFVVYGIFRYMYLIHKTRLGESPTNALLTDKPMVITVVLFILSVVAIIYRHELIRIISRYVPVQ
ncbi:MAG TPA: decaprenyl-phosphate phosphoribosyltransferase [Candidatus Acidoferrales bacterium]|nr:decaprenyl-phosphate phosphoribosyltransferase [Candidatus Acidoferrales bacterium]